MLKTDKVKSPVLCWPLVHFALASCSFLFLEVGLWLPPSPHPVPHAALWVLLYTKYCTLNFLKKRNFRESGRAKGF